MYSIAKNRSFHIILFYIFLIAPIFSSSSIIARENSGLYSSQFQTGMELLVVSNYAHEIINGQKEYIYEISI